MVKRIVRPSVLLPRNTMAPLITTDEYQWNSTGFRP
jgi:hypothetical protein